MKSPCYTIQMKYISMWNLSLDKASSFRYTSSFDQF